MSESMTFVNFSWRGPETETVLAIEYQPDRDGKLRPFQVFTDAGGYDFEYCRRDDTTYWHNSSNSRPYLHRVIYRRGDVRCAFWRAPGVEVGNGRVPRRALKDSTIRRMGFRILAEPLGNPFDDAFGDMQTIYCSRCKDWLPEESDHPCEHIWWCERCSVFSAPGDRCKHRRRAR